MPAVTKARHWLLGVLAACVSMVALAESKEASVVVVSPTVTAYGKTSDKRYPTLAESCAAATGGASVCGSADTGTRQYCFGIAAGHTTAECGSWYTVIDYHNRYDLCATGATQVGGQCVTYQCDDASWTLSGTTCTRPDCPEGWSRDAAGVCRQTCPTGTTWSSTAGGCACPL